MLAGLFEDYGAWGWIVLGMVLLGCEILAPGTVLLWLGMAAVATGTLAFVVDPGWQVELVIFAALALVAAVAWWRIGRPYNAARSDQPMLNRRAERYVGRVFTLDEPIARGEGRVRIDDTTWRVRGPDAAAGATVRVARADGAVLVVEAA